MQTRDQLHPLLQAPWGFAEQLRATLLETLRPLTAGQWVFRPTAQEWCIAEQVEHLLLAEIGSSKMARKLIRGDFRAQHPPAGATLHTAALDRYPFGHLIAPSSL
ncbi:MAG TPA: DinB family protein, partial [Candidatus Methylomirabilis sp.]|nr:DinB family protein [Candidatus Methylomirabilis sp.]